MFKRFLSIILIFAAILMIANKALNLHVHKSKDGALIVHAHPFNKSADNEPIKKHNHNLLDYVLLNQLDLIFIASILISVGIKFAPFEILSVLRKKCTGQVFIAFKPLRAPPFN